MPARLEDPKALENVDERKQGGKWLCTQNWDNLVAKSWLQTASAGFPNWESGGRQGFGKAKPAVMCQTRLKAPSP
jgi:hypothetical protein